MKTLDTRKLCHLLSTLESKFVACGEQFGNCRLKIKNEILVYLGIDVLFFYLKLYIRSECYGLTCKHTHLRGDMVILVYEDNH